MMHKIFLPKNIFGYSHTKKNIYGFVERQKGTIYVVLNWIWGNRQPFGLCRNEISGMWYKGRALGVPSTTTWSSSSLVLPLLFFLVCVSYENSNTTSLHQKPHPLMVSFYSKFHCPLWFLAQNLQTNSSTKSKGKNWVRPGLITRSNKYIIIYNCR